jgi:hypothetical protein
MGWLEVAFVVVLAAPGFSRFDVVERVIWPEP